MPTDYPALANEYEQPERPRRQFTLRADTDVAAIPSVSWLIDQHIPTGSLAVLYGPPESGKSFLALAWAYAVARGVPWLSSRTEQRPVVYVAAEGGFGLAQRITAYRDAHALTESLDLFFLTESLNLLDRAAVTDFIASISAKQPGLVVFDTMARSMVGGDENSTRDVGLVIAAVDQIRVATGAAALLVHHTGWTQDRERGSSALRAAADAMFSLKNDDGVLTLGCEKQKDAPHVVPQRLRLAVGPVSCTVEPHDERPPVNLTAAEKTALEVLQSIALQDEGATSTQWLHSCNLSERAFYYARKRLVERQFVAKNGKRYSITTAGTCNLQTTCNAPANAAVQSLHASSTPLRGCSSAVAPREANDGGLDDLPF